MKKTIWILVFTASGVLNAQTYWQQEVNYTINVKLDDVKHELNADASIEYINHSPNTLPFLYFHLWPNAYKNNKTALGKQCLENGKLNFIYAKDEDRGYIDGLDFKVNGQPVKMEYCGDSIDICKLFLNEPLAPGGKITITTPFHVKFPLGEYSRLGHIDQQYQVTQWFPKPAVYDQNGWNQMPYLDQGEFYSEWGSFDVSITVPKNYVLMATGDIVDGDAEYKWLEEKAKETKAKDFVATKETVKNGKLVRTPIYNDSFPASDAETKTLRFKQTNVHDFAWFCDKRYNVQKSEVELPHSKRKVTTWTFFTNGEAKTWAKSTEYINDALYYYSKWNGDYPYNHCTAVDGALSAGGGMEYPNITVIGHVGDMFTLETVIMHEVGHNWFYGILGSNERMHAWMDEGINSANENRYIKTKYPDRLLIGSNAGPLGNMFDLNDYMHKAQYELAYIVNAKRNLDQPTDFPSYEYTQLNYGGIVYSKSAIIFDYLMAYLGEETYDKCMQAYFEKWKFKHPQPADIRKVFEENTGKNLSWFFDDLINTTKKLDYKIVSYDKNTGDVTVKNTGDIIGPFCISGLREGKVKKTVWFEGFEGKKAVNFGAGNYDEVRIDAVGDIPEINRNNNNIRTTGILKKVEPLKFQFLGSIDNPKRSQIFWSPVMGWNKYNKFMLGAAFYNSLIPEKKFDYMFMPMYGFVNKSLAGAADIGFNFHPNGIFQTIRLGVNAKRYAFAERGEPLNDEMSYNKFTPNLTIEFRKKRLRSNFTSTVGIRSAWIIRDNYTVNTAFDPYIYSPVTDTFNVNEVSYRLVNAHNIHPYEFKMAVQQAEAFTKLMTEATFQYNFKKRGKNMTLRLFFGTFLDNSSPDAGAYGLRMSGAYGYQDYLYDFIYLGRTETDGLLSKQFTETDGGFKVFSPIGDTKEWLFAANFKSTLPIPVIRIFADAGMASGGDFQYDAGVYFSMARGILEVYFPLLYSNSYYLDFKDQIRFTLNLHRVKPFDTLRNFTF